jgi:hypothetical protein
MNAFWDDCFEDFKKEIMQFFNHSYQWEMERRATAEIVGNPTFQSSRLLILFSANLLQLCIHRACDPKNTAANRLLIPKNTFKQVN